MARVINCPNCGAAVPPVKNALETIRCKFCETEFHPPKPEPRPTGVTHRQTVIRQLSPEEEAKAKKSARRVGCCVLFFVFGTTGAGILFSFQAEQAVRDKVEEAQRDSKRKQEAVQDEIDARVYWWADYLPGIGQVKDETVIVGSVRRYSGGSYIVAINADGEERWSVGPMDPEDEHFRAHSIVSGQRVLTANSEHELQVLSLDTGKLIKKFKARSDKVSGFCVDETDPTLVKVKVADNSHVQVNLQKNRLKSLDKDDLKGCETWGHYIEKQLKGMDTKRRHPEPENTSIAHALFSSDGKTAVGGGYKSPGTSTPRAWGWNTKTGKINWTKDLTDSKNLAHRSNEWGVLLGNTYITHFEDDDIQTLIALNAKNGKTLWETPIYEDKEHAPTIDEPDLIVGKGDYVVVTAGNGIWIFEAKTGKRIGFYGDP